MLSYPASSPELASIYGWVKSTKPLDAQGAQHTVRPETCHIHPVTGAGYIPTMRTGGNAYEKLPHFVGLFLHKM